MYRYIGNKTKLLSPILETVRNVIGDEGTVADIMAGTGQVSKALFESGYSVISSDIMTYTKFHLMSELCIKSEPTFSKLSEIKKKSDSKYKDVIAYLNGLAPMEGFFYKEYSPDGKPFNGSDPRKYFTTENAKKIDVIRETINKWVSSNQITELEEALLKHSLIMSVNDVASISGTYGYFLSKFTKSALEPIELKVYSFTENHKNNSCTIMQGYAEELSKCITADLCYIDPPYMKRQYAANYHILETLAVGDCPTDLIGKSGLRNWWYEYSDFCTKTKGLQAFGKIFENMNCNNFLISYNEDGLFPIEILKDFFSKYGTVNIDIIDYQRFRSNQSSLPHNINEYLITVRR